MDKNPSENKAAFLVWSAFTTVLVLLAFVFIPTLNELDVYDKLQVKFAEFHATTTRNFPDKAVREERLKGILEAKDEITAAGSWPLITCKAEFRQRDAGSKRRKDELLLDCRWTVLPR